MTTPGAGATKRQNDWTLRSVLQDFLQDGRLSRRKRAWLQQQVDTFLAARNADEAPQQMLETASAQQCSCLKLTCGCQLCHCVAAVLEQINPGLDLAGAAAAKADQLICCGCVV